MIVPSRRGLLVFRVGDRRDCREAVRTVLLLCYLIIVAILYSLHGARSFIWPGSAVHAPASALDCRRTNLVGCHSCAGTSSFVGHRISDVGILVRNGAFIIQF